MKNLSDFELHPHKYYPQPLPQRDLEEWLSHTKKTPLLPPVGLLKTQAVQKKGCNCRFIILLVSNL